MAEIWPVYDGKEPTIGGPWTRLPLAEAIALCELRPSDFLSDLATRPRPRFGDVNRDLWYAGFKHVVVVIEEDEGQGAEWKPGFYKSHLAPKEVFRRLVEEPLVAALGSDNVVRVEVAPSIDALGRGAMLTTIVIAPDALPRLGSATLADAEMRLQNLLREMHVFGAAIVELATEAELAEDVSS
ncbi:MAG: hypothetical protein WAN86_21910 [Hyphomicrobiaceae bacterium]